MTKEEVINILKYELSQISDDERHPNLLQHKDFCKTVLEELEERPTGEWIKEEYFRGYYYEYKCSICGVQITANTKYCPYCGAKMINPKTLIDKLGPVFEQIAETATNFFEDETISGLLEEGEE